MDRLEISSVSNISLPDDSKQVNFEEVSDSEEPRPRPKSILWIRRQVKKLALAVCISVIVLVISLIIYFIILVISKVRHFSFSKSHLTFGDF